MSSTKKALKKAPGALMTDTIDPEIRSMIEEDGPMTSTQYAILMENARKKQALSEYKKKYADSLAENQKLRENDEVIRKEAFEVGGGGEMREETTMMTTTSFRVRACVRACVLAFNSTPRLPSFCGEI